MQLEYSFNEEHDGIELHFKEEPSEKEKAHLKESGFKEGFHQPLKWWVKRHPAFVTFAEELKETLLKGDPFTSVLIQPSFYPSQENIDHNKFSYVTITYLKGGVPEQESYVIFDPWKVVAKAVATRYGIKKYGSSFKEVDVTPRKMKIKARELLEKGKVITGETTHFKETGTNQSQHNSEPLANEHGVYTESLTGKNLEKINIPVPKAAKFMASVSIAKGTDGLYRYGITIDSKWEGISGQTFAPNVNSQTFRERQEALKAALDRIAGSTLNNDKAYKAIDQFAQEQGIELYKADDIAEPESEPDIPDETEIRSEAWQFTKAETDKLLNEDRQTSETRIRLVGSWTFHNKETGFEELKPDAPLAVRIAEGEMLVRGELSSKSHKQAVQEAMKEGKPVSQEVLADYPELTSGEEKPESLPEQLAELGFSGLFTAQEAFEKTLKIADIQSRWNDALGYFKEHIEKPKAEQIQRWETVLEALKGLKDKASKEQRVTLKEKIATASGEVAQTWAMMENEQIQFQQEMVQHVIDLAGKQGHAFAGKEQEAAFSSIVSVGLFDERAIEPYINESIPEIADQIIQDFFKTNIPVKSNNPDTNGVDKDIADNPILDMDDAWTMTPLEYQQVKAIEKTGSSMVLDAQDRRNHEAIVKQAIEDGQQVPQRVLDHYPWLMEEKPDNPEPASNPAKTDKLKKFAQFLSHYKTIDGHMNGGALKETFGRMGKAALKELGEYLGLKEFSVDFNKSGVAGSGDLTLMGMFETEKGIYISFNKDGFGLGVLYRTIKHMKDYTGGSNNYFNESEFATPEVIKEKVHRLVGVKPTTAGAKASQSSEAKFDYIDRVVAHMHDRYANGERPTKGYIEKLKETLSVPNSGMLWEAVELSWLLWYRQIYKEPLPFEQRLHRMVHFWHEQQPTYAYSDSSKELYKQYSTPCPIGAMVAQYTGMDIAQSIFEPSAGNGLLLVGADPAKCHVNEIDNTRLASLKFQGFHKITNYNAIQPFPDEMTKAYDVVVTNPPFAQWEEAKFDKELIIRKYFNNHVGLAGNIRLEHLMAGLALHTLKDTGKAAIIIMGHVYFGHDGFIAKYRPFFNWLYRNYQVDDVINMNSFKLYNKQGAIEKTMLILVGGRKAKPKGVAPQQHEAPYLYDMVNSFDELWNRMKPHIGYNINTVINQLQIELQV